MPQEEQTQDLDIIADEKSESILDNLFGVAPEEKVVAEEKIAEEVEEVEETEEVEEAEDESEETEETDYDDEKEEETEEEEEETLDESAAQKRAKEEGRKAKRLETELTERNLELARIKEEAKRDKEELEQLKAVRVDPRDNPEYKKNYDTITQDTAATSLRLKGKAREILPTKFGELMTDYLGLRALDHKEMLVADSNLRRKIIEDLELSEVPYEDLEAEEIDAFTPNVERVLDLLDRNANKTVDLMRLHDDLTKKSKTGKLAVDIYSYEASVKELSPVLESIGNMTDDLIAENPHSIESTVASLAKTEEGKKKLEAAKADILEVVLGPRALTQKEIDTLEEQGVDLKTFYAERKKRATEKRKKLLPLLVQGLVARSKFKSALEKAGKVSTKEDTEDSELDALLKTKKKQGTGKKKEVPIPASKRNVLAKLFPDSDYEDDF